MSTNAARAHPPGRYVGLSLLIAGGLLTAFYAGQHTPPDVDWPEYNGGIDRNHRSALTQLDTQTVSRLKNVWTYDSGGADTLTNRTQIQCNPLIIDGVLYGVSAGSQAFALDAATGRERWKTALVDETFAMTSRGLTYWSDGTARRIFFAYGHWLYALDAQTGQPVATFGQAGKISLRDGLSRPGADEYVLSNTPGVIFENRLIMGTRVSEGPTALPGDIRAYDVTTGRVVWTFHTIPKPGEYGYATWPKEGYRNVGGANNWMGMALDRRRGIVYAPTGSAAFDFYGGNRKGTNLFANCLLALDARTGKRIWHYQLVHHDIWDRDPPAPPNLVTIRRNNQWVEAVAQITKQGHVFVFNRLTGQPLFPVEEKTVPGSPMPGEQTSPTQPIPLLPTPFTRQSFTAQDLNAFVADRAQVLAEVQQSRTGTPYLPITRQRTILYPGSDGGAQWGGAAVDAQGIMYVPAKEIPVYTSLTDAPLPTALTSGETLYQTHCSSCHGADRRGDHSGTYPSLLGIGDRMDKPALLALLAKGRGMMPAFTHLSEAERSLVVDFVGGKVTAGTPSATRPARTWVPYVHTGYNRWYDRAGYPVSQPPWGTLTAIDLNTGSRRWQVPLGEYRALLEKGIPPTGTDNYGGPLVTASGLVFIAATPDQKLRVFNARTGRLVWETVLPAAGYASPSTYAVGGKQYVVIACGGGKLRSKSGGRYVAFAFALPD